jgi:hypothetical protein
MAEMRNPNLGVSQSFGVRPHPLHDRRYLVLVDGKLPVKNPRDPECDAARALLARGYTGKLTLCDGKTGIPRTIIDIERAAKLSAEEGPNGPRFSSLQSRGERGYSPRTHRAVSEPRMRLRFLDDKHF